MTKPIMQGMRQAASKGSFLILSLLAGCSVFTNPFSDRQTYTQGGKPVYNMTNMAAENSFEAVCIKKENESDDDYHARMLKAPQCNPYAKLILTRPDSNVSYQFIKLDDKKNFAGTITCASPAEVARALAETGNIAASIPVQAASPAVAASGVQSTTETITVIPANNAASNYVATASFYNCMAYASGIYGPVTTSGNAPGTAEQVATKQQTYIFLNAVPIAAASAVPASIEAVSSVSATQGKAAAPAQ